MSPFIERDSTQTQALTWREFFSDTGSTEAVQEHTDGFPAWMDRIMEFPTQEVLPAHASTELQPAASRGIFESLPRSTSPGSDWLLAPLLVSLLLITLSRALYPRRFRHIFSSLLSSNNMNILLREGFTLGEPISVLLFGNFILVMGLFFLLMPGYLSGIDFPGLPTFLIYPALVILVVFYIFLKVAGITISGNVFRTQEESSTYLLNIFLFNQVIGVLLWPLMLVTIYMGSTSVFMLAAGLLVILYLVRGIKGLLIGLGRSRFSPVLFLFYLCTLEIIPLLLVLRLITIYT